MRKDYQYRLNELIKRLFDLSLALLGALAFLPFFPIIFLVILLDEGLPVFFVKPAVGRCGRVFFLYKFRTMNYMDSDDWTPTAEKDPRITRVGRFLRKTAMDELPQLFNILKGDMSFVGPRPVSEKLYSRCLKESPDFSRRCQARPGLTGLAQVELKHDSPWPDKVALDLKYCSEANIFQDLYLLWLSLRRTLIANWE